MSGKASRWRRREAVRAARTAVYRNDGRPCAELPFDNDRQNRIFLKAYVSCMEQYTRMELLRNELESVYGPVQPNA